MTKTQTISYINTRLGNVKLGARNTTFASISKSKYQIGWWMNIKRAILKKTGK